MAVLASFLRKKLTAEMEPFANIVNGFYPLTIFAKGSILAVSHLSEVYFELCANKYTLCKSRSTVPRTKY